jgi:hypothetical protein
METHNHMKSLASYLRVSIALGMLLVTGTGQVLHSGEEIFVITVRGSRGVTFRGSYLVSPVGTEEPKNFKTEGAVPTEIMAQGSNLYLSFQKQTVGGELEVEIAKNGTAIKRQRTDAPYGVVALASTQPAGGLPRQTEYEVDGTVKFATITMTSETGDIEQRLVPVPFSKEFFPRSGWIIGLLAQKTRVAGPDPLYLDGRLKVKDDGVSGSVHVSIRVSGTILGKAETSDPYGVASATVRVP